MSSKIVFYFSGTGNSFSVAKKLFADATLVDMFDEQKESFSADIIGFVYPTYCFDVPPFVENYIKNLTFNAKYIFCVTTCGGACGNALGTVGKIIKEKGQLVDYFASIVLPDNSIIFKSNEVDKISMLENEDKNIQNIATDIENSVKNTAKVKPLNKMVTSASWGLLKGGLGINHQRVTYKCTKCGICIKNCPMSNIAEIDNKMMFFDKCAYCFRCIHICPNFAVGFGLLKNTPTARYIHKDFPQK